MRLLASRSLCSSLVVVLSLWLSACSATDYTPPVFNAVDPSISCPAGLVGWDFSTGGNVNEELNAPTTATTLKVVEATFGANVGQPYGNWSEQFAASCNDRLTCDRKVFALGDSDPAPGNNKAFQLKYQCGAEPAVYQIDVAPSLPGAVDNTVVSLRCGEKLTVVRASYGANCSANNTGNFTQKVLARCAGVRRCQLETPGALFGADPSPGCVKQAALTYRCGNDPTEQTVSWGEQESLDLQCPVQQRAAPPDQLMHVRSSTYGSNCRAPTDNAKAAMIERCDNKVSCTIDLGRVLSDPCPNTPKEFETQFTCGTAGALYKKIKPAAQDVANRTATVSCGDVIHLVEASYGKNCSASNANNLMGALRPKCDGQRFCGVEPANTQIADPSVGCAKRAELTWTCGSSTEVLAATFGEGERIQFECPIARQPPGPASGIRVVEATFGANCVGTATNNQYTQATQACFGRDVCDFIASGPDPKFGCAKELTVKYTCGDEPETLVATVPATREGAPARLSCGPVIAIDNATYGENVNASLSGNITNDAKEQCEGRRGRCEFKATNLIDPATGRAKNVQLYFHCGADPALRLATISAPADDKTVMVECPTPAVPYRRTACVPEQCVRNERRDQNLNCVADNSLVTIGVSSGALEITDGDGAAVREFVEGNPYSLKLTYSMPFTPTGVRVGDSVPVSPAAVWVSDNFKHIPGTRFARDATSDLQDVTALRCVVGSIGLKLGPTPTKLVGAISNTLISPNCFGQRISSWRDAAKRVGWTEAEFRRSYTMDNTRHDLHVSFDPEGRALSKRGVNGSFDLVPNPIGFFYHPDRLWADFYEYYRQTDFVTFTPTNEGLGGWGFRDSKTIELKALKATLREAKVNMAGVGLLSLTSPLYGPNELGFDLEFEWAMLGDSPGRNPFSPTGLPLANNVQTLAQRHFGATVEVAREDTYAAALSSSRGWVRVPDTEVVNRGAYPDFQLSEGLATGKSERFRVRFTEALRNRVMRPWNGAPSGAGSNGGWAGSSALAVEGFSRFKVRVCLNADGLPPRPYDTASSDGVLTATRGETFSLLMKSARQCVVADQVLLINRDLRKRSVSSARSSAQSSSGRSVAQGDSNVSTAQDFGTESGCGPLASADGGTLDGGVLDVCRTTDQSSFGSTGAGGRSLYRTTTDVAGSRAQGAGQSQLGMKTQVLGYNVFNQDSDNTASVSSPLTLGWQTTDSLSPKPQWGKIAKAIKAAFVETKAEPVQPRVDEWRGKKYAGLGVGVRVVGLWPIGPIPVSVELGFGIKLGPGASALPSFNLVTSQSSNPDDYPCINTSGTRCIVRSSPGNVLTFNEASDTCRFRGGRLLELNTPAAVAAAQQRVADAPTEEVWVGGQLAYAYADPTCGNGSTNEAACAANSTTFYEWVDSQLTFATQSKLNPTLVNGTLYEANWGADQAKLVELRTKVPAAAGVAFRASDQHLLALEATQRRRYLCEYEPAAVAFGYRLTKNAGLDVALGFDFSVCVPDVDVGLCISADLDLVAAGISYTEEDTNWLLYDSQLRKLGTRGLVNHAVNWEVSFLSGSIAAELRLLYLSLRWEIVRFSGIQSVLAPGLFDGKLYELKYPTWSNQ